MPNILESMFSGGFNAQKLKPQLKMACGRIQIASNKKAALLKQSMREVALVLAEDPPKEEKARIRAEALIRDDNLIEAYEILQLECELLHERIKLIQYSKQCPHDLVSVISTLMWASHRVDIPELFTIRKQFTAKYGKAFEENAMKNYDGCLNERVVSKLSVEPPAAYLVQTYLERICEQFQVDWTPSMKLSADKMIEPMAAPVGFSVPEAQGTGLLPPKHSVVTGEEASASASTAMDPNAIPPAIHPTMPTAPSFRSTAGSVVPPPPAASSGSNNSAAPGMFDEPDIFVPHPASSTIQEDKKDEDDNNNHDDDDDDDQGPATRSVGTKGSMTDSYANLAARFDSLSSKT